MIIEQGHEKMQTGERCSKIVGTSGIEAMKPIKKVTARRTYIQLTRQEMQFVPTGSLFFWNFVMRPQTSQQTRAKHNKSKRI